VRKFEVAVRLGTERLERRLRLLLDNLNDPKDPRDVWELTEERDLLLDRDVPIELADD